MSKGTCETCRWFVAEQGECRRNAPIFHEACGSMWPQNISRYDFCGEHTPPSADKEMGK